MARCSRDVSDTTRVYIKCQKTAKKKLYMQNVFFFHSRSLKMHARQSFMRRAGRFRSSKCMKVHQRVKQHQSRSQRLNVGTMSDKRKGRIYERQEGVRESIKRTDRHAGKRVKPGKEKRGKCRKENIGNSISGGATSHTPEYISSSYREREKGG